jgi:hypothetical protein
MDRPLAKLLIEVALALDKPLNTATELTDQIPDETERKAVRRAITDILGATYSGLILPIVRQYPDLDPEKPENKER